MAIYYFTIIIFIIFGYIYERVGRENNAKIIAFIVLVFSIAYGFRFEVGVDWFNYVKVYERQVADIWSLNTIEVGYKALNVIAYYMDIGIVTVIFLSTVFFITFTLLGAKKAGVNPFYFFAIVAPYHLVMSGVNYTRQGVALSIFIYAVACLINNKKNQFLLFIILAGSFHTSALCFAPLYFIEHKKRYVVLLFALIIPPIVYSMLMEYSQYIDSTMESSGVYLRSVFLLVPTVLLLLHINTVKTFSLIEQRLVSIVICSFPLVVLFSVLSSTIADRFAYYFILLSTLCWMLVSARNTNINARFLKPYGNFILFITAMFAFVVWALYTKYIKQYEFDSYFNYWLS
ncbi:EpsG family protein [Pseudoalteromonas sp. FUC4]|uniref:EpsG family protein n=1 Tax=Pseudoalteromonas sp. FUC4 TaxID=2511201 RepID=UPI0011F3DE75|nr:EpsG family protein [Pseudoalteromonas sp. FUC4]KAA1152450.1 EpsG family protein [Pseudoalteromonas sp. FUC4]